MNRENTVTPDPPDPAGPEVTTGPPPHTEPSSDGAPPPTQKEAPSAGGGGLGDLQMEQDMLLPPMPEAFDAVGYKDLELETTRMPLEATFVSSMTPRTMRIHLKARRKNQIKREHLERLLPELPAPNTCFHVVSRGNFDFWTYVPHIVSLTEDGFDEAYISTWTLCRDVAVDMLTLFDQHKLRKISLLTGTYFKRRETAVYAFTVDGLIKRGQRYKAFLNHTKIILLRNKDISLVLEGSANLTANPRAENFMISNHPGLYDFHRTWIEELYGGQCVK